MLSDLPNALSVYDKQRIAIARQVIERKKQEMGDHVRAAACYGSVAHYASGEYSDVEMIVVTDDTILAKNKKANNR